MAKSNYQFEEPIPKGHPLTGVILSDQIRTMDWRVRQAVFICALPAEIVESAYARFTSLMPQMDIPILEEDSDDE